MTDETWLITGGCGFIGTAVISALRARGAARIRVFDNLSVGTLADLERASPYELAPEDLQTLSNPARDVVQFVRGDIVDEQAMLRAARNVQVMVHLAANTGVAPSVENPRLDCMANVIGTLNALEAARHAGARRFVFASSGAPIGEATPPIHEELAAHPVSPYGASKLAGEGYCSAYARTFKLPTVALRFGNVYGPGSTHKSSVVAKFIRDAVSNGVLRINGDGSQTRDFVFVKDLVQAILAASEVPGIGGEVFQIATQREVTVSEIAELVSNGLSRHGVPAPRLAYDAPRLGDVQRNYSDTSKARTRLGWQASTSIEEGIDRTIQWFLAADGSPPTHA